MFGREMNFANGGKLILSSFFQKKLIFIFSEKKKTFETFVTRIESIIWSLLKVKLIDYRFHFLL
jgi:hypothetical protein